MYELIPGKLYSTIYAKTAWHPNLQKYISITSDDKLLFVKPIYNLHFKARYVFLWDKNIIEIVTEEINLSKVFRKLE